jgi:hypothetical protein
MKAKHIGIILCLVLSLPFPAMAKEGEDKGPSGGWTPYQLSIFSPAQIFPEDWNVYGLRTSVFYGNNRDIYGLDLGPFFNKARDIGGLQLAGFGVNKARDVTGLQISGFMNEATGDVNGIQIGLGNKSRNLNGFQIAPLAVNVATGDVKGAQISYIINAAEGNLTGFQLGGVNSCSFNISSIRGGFKASGDITGVQIGYIGNYTNDVNGVQIGGLSPGLFLLSVSVLVPPVGCILGATMLMENVKNGSETPASENKVSTFLDAFSSNLAKGNTTGLQIGVLINNTKEDVNGLQLGPVNIAERVKGIQVGAINYCKTMTGIQIGAINIITEGALPFFPGINVSFSF